MLRLSYQYRVNIAGCGTKPRGCQVRTTIQTGVIKQGLGAKMQTVTHYNSPCNASNSFMEHIWVLHWT